MAEKCESFYKEAEKVEEELGSEKLDDSRKQALCSKLAQLVTKSDSSHAASIQIVKSDLATDWLTSLTENKKLFSRPTKTISANCREWKSNIVSFIHIGW